MNWESKIQTLYSSALEFGILVLISVHEIASSSLVEGLREKAFHFKEADVYSLLNRLKRHGLVETSWKENPSGPPSKYLSLTPAGRNFLTLQEKGWKQICEGINNLN